MRKWIGTVLLGWYLPLPYRGDVKPATGQSDSLPRWQRVGAYQSALGCELARQARMERDRALVMTGVCVLSGPGAPTERAGTLGGESARDESGVDGSGGLLGPSGDR